MDHDGDSINLGLATIETCGVWTAKVLTPKAQNYPYFFQIGVAPSLPLKFGACVSHVCNWQLRGASNDYCNYPIRQVKNEWKLAGHGLPTDGCGNRRDGLKNKAPGLKQLNKALVTTW